jgi:Uma2 family endonuclease
MQQLAKKNISAHEYFTMEEVAEYKNEYYHGEIFAMSGASFHHNLIAMNVSGYLHGLLRDSECFVLSGDMKIQIDEDTHYTYPDICVVCGNIEFVGDRTDVIDNPLVIIEILSESTKDYDRGSKFTAYRNIASLKDYILIDQYTPHIEYFHKDKGERWTLSEYKNIDDTFKIISIDIVLSMKTVYHRVKW